MIADFGLLDDSNVKLFYVVTSWDQGLPTWEKVKKTKVGSMATLVRPP